MRIRLAILALLFLMPFLVFAGTVQLFQDFSSDPEWESVRNRLPNPNPPTIAQDFGYSLTSHAGGVTGEIGGQVWNTHRRAYYGKVLASYLHFTDHLTCTGKFSITQASHTVGWTSSSNVFFGWFNAERQGWRPVNFIGLNFRGSNEPVENLASVELCYGTGNWKAGAFQTTVT